MSVFGNEQSPLSGASSTVSALPVAPQERFSAVDTLRGFALLGILAINIDFFALPCGIIFNPTIAGGFTGLDLLTYKVNSMLFLQKMMAIFSMLFGGGLILMTARAEKAGAKIGGVYYRRILWLLLFGIIHAYLFWYGDILVTYALCGLLLFPLRRRSHAFLISLGIAFIAFGILIQVGVGFLNEDLRNDAKRISQAREAGQEISARQEAILNTWDEIKASMMSGEEETARKIEAFRGSFADVQRARVKESLMIHTQAFPFMMFWRVFGLMLIGMGLMKTGFFKAAMSTKTYAVVAIVGYVIGLPLVYYGTTALAAHQYDIIYQFKIGGHFNNVGSILVALAHAGVIMILCKKGLLTGPLTRFAAVGRMALSNYFLHTLIGTTLFFGGYGLGLFGQINRFGLFWIAVAIWILQLAVSPIWLARFRFGPFEWLWRSLSYRKKQPMSLSEASE